jgi:hypothetical protein
VSTLHFEPGAHRYSLDGAVIPSVTQVLHDLGIIDYGGVPTDVLEEARLRGVAVHHAVMLANEGTLDPATVDERLEPYLFAYEAFRVATGFAPVFFEQPLAHLVLRYGGTPDAAGPVNGELAVVDFKAIEQLSQPYGVQVAAYKMLLREAGYAVTKRLVVQLKRDGGYRIEPYRDPVDEAEFKSALFLWQRRAARNGGTYRKETA